MSLLVEVATGGVRGGTSILYAALGETLSERAGVINLGTEGSMLCGALAAYATTAATGNPWSGVAAGAAAGGSLALVHAVLVLARKANQLATGFVVLFLGLGLTSLFGAAYVGREISPFAAYRVPLLADIPWVGPILFNHDPLVYLSYAVAPAMWWLLYRSRWGAASARRRRAARRARDLRSLAAGRCSTSPWCAGACSPASAERICRPRTPTPGSRTWCRAAASSRSPS